MQVQGRTVLVTGGTDGIGRELALQLKAKGATVIVSGRTPERLKAARSDGFEAIEADLSSRAGVDAVLAAMAGCPLDLLINNAGMGSDHDVSGPVDLAENDRCIWLNLNAPMHLIVGLLETLRARPEAMIVNVTSGLAIAPRAGSPVYCATKAGLRSYTQALRYQLRDSNVRVIEALPPVVETRMTAGRGGAKMAARDCAAAILRAIEANAHEANVGMVRVLQAVNSISPALARRIMLRF